MMIDLAKLLQTLDRDPRQPTLFCSDFSYGFSGHEIIACVAMKLTEAALNPGEITRPFCRQNENEAYP
jgi:hypothetical protein